MNPRVASPLASCLIAAAVNPAAQGPATAEEFRQGSFMRSPDAKTLVLMDPPRRCWSPCNATASSTTANIRAAG